MKNVIRHQYLTLVIIVEKLGDKDEYRKSKLYCSSDGSAQ